MIDVYVYVQVYFYQDMSCLSWYQMFSLWVELIFIICRLIKHARIYWIEKRASHLFTTRGYPSARSALQPLPN